MLRSTWSVESEGGNFWGWEVERSQLEPVSSAGARKPFKPICSRVVAKVSHRRLHLWYDQFSFPFTNSVWLVTISQIMKALMWWNTVLGQTIEFCLERRILFCENAGRRDTSFCLRGPGVTWRAIFHSWTPWFISVPLHPDPVFSLLSTTLHIVFRNLRLMAQPVR